MQASLLIALVSSVGQDARDLTDRFESPEGCQVSLWAESPQLYNPTAIDVDPQGRVWVAEAVNYRRWGGRNPGIDHSDGDRIVILDHYSEVSHGGSGLSFDWAAAEGVANRDRVMLAGGLNPENVGSAIAQLSPWGVDVASGVETEGVKDPDRIRAFISAIQNA